MSVLISGLSSWTAVYTDKIEVETSSGVSKYTTLQSVLLNVVYPLGSFYTQYPSVASSVTATALPSSHAPESLFVGSSWTLMYNTENVFFRTEGTDYQSRTGGLSADEVGAHTHVIDGATALGGGGTALSTSGYTSAASVETSLNSIVQGVSTTSRTGAVTEPRNRLLRIWQRTA